MIICLLSGGVDSTLSLIIVKKMGYKNLFCINIKMGKFCLKKNNAKNIAKKINSKIFFLKLNKFFKKKIFRPFIKSFIKGKTPNSDIKCNNKIKFKIFKFFKKIKKNRTFLVTGHYVINYKKKIKISHDNKKDQSYFLYGLKKNIKYSYFPIGFFLKLEVRKILFFLNFKNFKKISSKGVCFIEKKFKNWIYKYIYDKKYNSYFYDSFLKYKIPCYINIGQKINIKNKIFYIFKKNRKLEKFYLCKKKSILLFSNRIKIKNFFKKIKILLFKINNCSKLKKCIIYSNNVIFLYPEKNISIGQSIVFYKKNILLFGSIINKSFCKGFINY
ncbi:hypothetical protein [Candidatus Vidania fulgoroideorum]